MAKPEARRPLGSGFSVAFKFDDGDMRLPLEEYIASTARDAAHVAILKDRRRRTKVAGKAERPGARSPVKARVEAVMKSAKANGSTFKGFLEAWQADPVDDLIVTLRDDKFVVLDDRDDTSQSYLLSTLDKMWGKA